MVAYSFGLVGQLGKNRDTFSQSTPPFTFDYPQLSAIPRVTNNPIFPRGTPGTESITKPILPPRRTSVDYFAAQMMSRPKWKVSWHSAMRLIDDANGKRELTLVVTWCESPKSCAVRYRAIPGFSIRTSDRRNVL
jgi:hypothetical protein